MSLSIAEKAKEIKETAERMLSGILSNPANTSTADTNNKYDTGMCLRMSKAQVSKLAIGEKISASVEGTVKGIRECYDGKDLYDVDLKAASISSVSTVNSVDKSYKKMTTK